MAKKYLKGCKPSVIDLSVIYTGCDVPTCTGEIIENGMTLREVIILLSRACYEAPSVAWGEIIGSIEDQTDLVDFIQGQIPAVAWGNINGNIEEQEDLINYLANNFYDKGESDELLDNKVDKEEGKSLVDDDQIDKLEDLDTQDVIDQKISEAINLSNSSYYPLEEGVTELPVPPLAGGEPMNSAWVFLTQGVTYTQDGGNPITALEGHDNRGQWDGSEWSLVDMGELPTTPTSDEVTPTGQLAVSEKGVYDYTKPLFDLTIESANLSDNVFELGGWNAVTGSPISVTNVKRLPTITITEDLIGQHWINGRGQLPGTYAYVIVRTTVSNPPAISIAGMGDSDNLDPITFTITPEMVGMMLRLSPGNIASEPAGGYENSFTWNMGEEPMNSFIPKGGVLVDGNKVSEVALEVLEGKKVVRAGRLVEKTYVGAVEGVEGGDGSGFYSYSSGILQASTQRKIITFPVNDSLKYALTGMINGSVQIADAVYFDSEMNYLGYNERVESGDIQLNRRELVLPTGTAYIGTGNRNQYDYPVLEQFTEELLGWDSPVLESELTIEGGYITEIKGKGLKSSISESPLLGKRIVKLGDSIMRAGGQYSSPGFVEQIASKYGMNINEYSQGGAVITYNGNGVNDIVRQVDSLISDAIEPDYIIMNGYTNDINISAIQLGELSEMFDSPLDIETFTGALEHICKTLKVNFPGAKILYVRVHKMSSRSFEKQESFGQRAVEVLNKWCVPIADIYNNGGLNSYLPEMRDMYTIPSSGDPDIGDRTHPNKLGYEKWYVPIVENLLNTI